MFIRNIHALLCLLGLVMALPAQAVQPFTIICGDGQPLSVPDSAYRPGMERVMCLKAGRPAPATGNTQPGLTSTVPPHNSSDTCPQYDPNDPRLPSGHCQKPKDTIKYDPDCARLNGCEDKQNASPNDTLSAEGKKQKVGLLLPAVQAAREAAKKACGSNTSISAALDQCGKKGYSFASCTQSSGTWSCHPSEDKRDPNLRPTGLSSGR